MGVKLNSGHDLVLVIILGFETTLKKLLNHSAESSEVHNIQ